MASKVKVPLLGQQNRTVVIVAGLGGLGIAAYLIHRHRQQAQAAAMASAQNASAYGYGQSYADAGQSYGYGTVSGSPGGSYGYGTGGGWFPPGYYGYGGNSNPPAEDNDQPPHQRTVTKITVPQVTGDRAKVARQTLRHAGLHYNISDRAVGVVKAQHPPGGTPVTQGSTVNLTL